MTMWVILNALKLSGRRTLNIADALVAEQQSSALGQKVKMTYA